MAFPTNPVNGQTYGNKRYDASKSAWVDLDSDPPVRAVLSGQTATAPGVDLVWSSVLEDTHNAVNAAKTAFTAPMDGLYLFTGSALATQGPNGSTITYRKNGKAFTPPIFMADMSSKLAADVSIFDGIAHAIRLNAKDAISLCSLGTTSAANPQCVWEITWISR